MESTQTAVPRLEDVDGRVVGVSFAPERESVRIRTTGGEYLTCLAEPRLLEKALAVRHTLIVAKLLVRHDLMRLLAIHANSEQIDELSEGERTENTLAKWDELLKRLA